MNKPSEFVRMPRKAAEDILKSANQVGAMDRTEGLLSGAGYANALGRANGIGKEIAAYLTVYLENAR